ncbi:hypothetical protein LMG26411_02723 [Cupriavidus numazuensis]|uniref:Uncharacterized protein n=1 Tax=Cupriavidus numazuensis TaxID=221992 RepID=A0ABM8TGQ7_9BURK|nr:hypothetical protein LMG26411_02723 [Cupriavidus numazuensis]
MLLERHRQISLIWRMHGAEWSDPDVLVLLHVLRDAHGVMQAHRHLIVQRLLEGQQSQ